VTGGAVDVKQSKWPFFWEKSRAKTLHAGAQNFELEWTRSLFCSEKELSSLIFIVIGPRW
jgi:hypothetical protein